MRGQVVGWQSLWHARERESIGRQGHVSWLRERVWAEISIWVSEWVNGSDDQKTRACVAVFVKGHQPHNAIMLWCIMLLLFVASCCCCCSIYYTIYKFTTVVFALLFGVRVLLSPTTPLLPQYPSPICFLLFHISISIWSIYCIPCPNCHSIIFSALNHDLHVSSCDRITF